MAKNDDLRYTKMPLNNGSGAIPALGFGTLIPDPVATKVATKAALEAGFRQLDASERYRNEKEVGEAVQEVFKAGKIKREDVFIATKVWNNNHRPERVKPAFEASLKRLQLDYVDLYLIHTPFAFQPGDEQDPRDANGNVIYDMTLVTAKHYMEKTGLDDGGRKAIGLRRRPDERDLRGGFQEDVLQDPIVDDLLPKSERPRGPGRPPENSQPENFDVSALPEEDVRKISEGIKTRVRFNPVVETGVPGFIPRSQH